jgi:hypothetical protein
MSTTGENEQPRAILNAPAAHEAAGQPAQRLDWQSELDSAMTDLDTKLSHPRRRASDGGEQPTLPQLGQVEITNELLDEIAWRVAQQMRLNAPATVAADQLSDTLSRATPPPSAALPEPDTRGMPQGIAVSIRVRRPLIRWRFWRRTRRRRMISVIDLRGAA